MITAGLEVSKTIAKSYSETWITGVEWNAFYFKGYTKSTWSFGIRSSTQGILTGVKKSLFFEYKAGCLIA